MTNLNLDPRVQAIRQDPKIGRNTCSSVDECYTDAELVRELNEAGIRTVKRALSYFRRSESLYMEQVSNASWGE